MSQSRTENSSTKLFWRCLAPSRNGTFGPKPLDQLVQKVGIALAASCKARAALEETRCSVSSERQEPKWLQSKTQYVISALDRYQIPLQANAMYFLDTTQYQCNSQCLSHLLTCHSSRRNCQEWFTALDSPCVNFPVQQSRAKMGYGSVIMFHMKPY